MLEWVDNVLVPYAATVPIGIIPILFLDSFKVHMLGTVVNAIHKLGVELEFIPPGCTGLVQPIDVGFNTPYKANYTKFYTKFLMNQDANQPLSGAKREDVSQWILGAVGAISEETVKNAWSKKGCSYFEG